MKIMHFVNTHSCQHCQFKEFIDNTVVFCTLVLCVMLESLSRAAEASSIDTLVQSLTVAFRSSLLADFLQRWALRFLSAVCCKSLDGAVSEPCHDGFL